MSSVKILRRKTDDASKKTGLSKYADSVERCLEKEGIDFDRIPFKIDAGGGYFDLFRKGFLSSFLSTLRAGSKETIFHATDELCGIFFPFAKGKKIVTIHHVPDKGEYRGGAYYSIWYMVAGIALRNADRIIAVSEQTKGEVLERFKVDPKKVVCITNTVNDIFDIREDVGKEKVIGCVAALIPRKNVSSSITAFDLLTKYPDTSEYLLEICGKGQEKEKLMMMTADLGLEDRVRFVSDLDDEGIARLYNRSMLVFNTSSHEGLGLVTLEAQRCGVPVLHLESARIPEPVTRYSVPCRDETEMAEKAHFLLMNKEEYDSAARASKEYADSFGNNICREYTGLILELKNEY